MEDIMEMEKALAAVKRCQIVSEMFPLVIWAKILSILLLLGGEQEWHSHKNVSG